MARWATEDAYSFMNTTENLLNEYDMDTIEGQRDQITEGLYRKVEEENTNNRILSTSETPLNLNILPTQSSVKVATNNENLEDRSGSVRKCVSCLERSTLPCTCLNVMNNGDMMEELTVRINEKSKVASVTGFMKVKGAESRKVQWKYRNSLAGGSGSGNCEDVGGVKESGIMVDGGEESRWAVRNEFRRPQIQLARQANQIHVSGAFVNNKRNSNVENVFSNTRDIPIPTNPVVKSGFSQFFAKNVSKEKGVTIRCTEVCDGLDIASNVKKEMSENCSAETNNRSLHNLHEAFASTPTAVHNGINLREWLKPGSRKVNKAESLHVFKQIVKLVDVAHSQQVALQDLRASSFELLPSNRVKYIGSLASKQFAESASDISTSYMEQRSGYEFLSVLTVSRYSSLSGPGLFYHKNIRKHSYYLIGHSNRPLLLRLCKNPKFPPIQFKPFSVSPTSKSASKSMKRKHDDEDHDSENTESESEAEIQAPIHTDKQPAPAPPRVKVKLKSSKKLDSSDAQSDPYLSLEKQDEAKGGLELPSQVPIIGYTSKKSASIKIKSSRGGLATALTSPVIMYTSGDRITEPKTVAVPPQKVSQYNREELATALGVIKKIMKMDAAEPFNTPVDPIALGIPDYLDIIDTPMDFGTICNNLELGRPYKNSEDVYNDVQYIWDNCYKYNNKGDYIVDLMKRVKKNFMKYWTAAGLYSNQPNKNIASEGLLVGVMAPSHQEKVHVKGTGSKYKKKGRHGFHKHKADCMCAICGVRRRSNAKLVETQIQISDGNVSQEFKQEEPYTDNHYSEDASSNLDRSDADVDMEDQNEETPEKVVNPRDEMEEVTEIKKMRENQQFQVEYESGKSEMEESPVTSQTQNSKHDTTPLKEDEALEILKSQLKHDSQLTKQQNMMCKNIVIDGNPAIMELCGTLFSTNPKSIWSGPHSLVRRNLPVRKKSYGIYSALETLMK